MLPICSMNHAKDRLLAYAKSLCGRISPRAVISKLVSLSNSSNFFVRKSSFVVPLSARHVSSSRNFLALLNALPASVNHLPNSLRSKVENLCQGINCLSTSGILFPDGFNVFRAKLSISDVPSFLNHVVRIVLASSKEQMIWIYTRWVITFMEATQSFRDGAKMNLPRMAVCPSELSVNHEGPVTVPISCSSPNPALAEVGWIRRAWRCASLFVDFLKESLLIHKRKTPAAFESKSANESGIKDNGCESVFSFFDALNASHGQPQLVGV